MPEPKPTPETEIDLVILPRPQVTVTLNRHDEVEIATAAIDDNYSGVEHQQVTIPLECVPEIIASLQRMLAVRGK